MSEIDIHIIGAGIAGLTVAVELSNAGKTVKLWEASAYAGGRCRSFYDAKLGMEIDNGNHLLLGVNKSALELIKKIGSQDQLYTSSNPSFQFMDMESKEEWDIFPGKTFSSRSRVPGASWYSYLRSVCRLVLSKKHAVVSDVLNGSGTQILYERLWQPLAVSMLNTPDSLASARMFRSILYQSFISGYQGLLPYSPLNSWGKTLIEPALDYISQRNASIEYKARIKKISVTDGYVSHIVMADREVPILPNQHVILAVPQREYIRLMPNLNEEEGIKESSDKEAELVTHQEKVLETHAIVNVHFSCQAKSDTYHKEVPFMGIVGGTAEWLFFRSDLISSTTSAADDLAKKGDEIIAEAVWKDVCLQQGWNSDRPLPPYRVIREKQATFSCSPENIALRATVHTQICNLKIAGDHTQTGLPATIEGAVQSGNAAASAVMAMKL